MFYLFIFRIPKPLWTRKETYFSSGNKSTIKSYDFGEGFCPERTMGILHRILQQGLKQTSETLSERL